MGEHLGFWCPGCAVVHVLNVAPGRRPCWAFDGNYEAPTFSPSVLVRGFHCMTDEDYDRILAGDGPEPRPFVCHSFVRNGAIEYLADCTHELAGRTVPLTDPEDPACAS